VVLYVGGGGVLRGPYVLGQAGWVCGWVGVWSAACLTLKQRNNFEDGTFDGRIEDGIK
jgi:hypothetical protein